MAFIFSPDEIKEQRHMAELEDMVYHVASITGSGKRFMLEGKFMVDGEMFHDFPLEVELVEPLAEPSAVSVMEAEWEWYDIIVKTD